MSKENSPIVKELARLVSKEELQRVTGAGTRVVGPKKATSTSTEETYPPGSSTPTQLDTIVETP